MPDKVCRTCIWWDSDALRARRGRSVSVSITRTCLRIGDEGNGRQYLDGTEHINSSPFCFLSSTEQYTCDNWTEDAP